MNLLHITENSTYCEILDIARPLSKEKLCALGRMSFAGLDPRFVLTGVTVTDRELGRGSIAIVLEARHNGKKYAGKQVYAELSGSDHWGRRFEQECRLLNQFHHPNIVQFVGIYFQPGEHLVPTLVMELLPTDLHQCIEQQGILPKGISYSILHDVALGLHYLHSQSPPIMHRDISAVNILLTSKMKAKICDFTWARSLTPHTKRLSQTPGTAIYMPPEAMLDDPRYNTSIDVFSYGIVMIFIFSGKFPEPAIDISVEDHIPLVRSEAERREKYLQAIGYDHPAMELILQCIANDPQQRPSASEISHQIKRICQYDGKWSVAHNSLFREKYSNSQTKVYT